MAGFTGSAGTISDVSVRLGAGLVNGHKGVSQIHPRHIKFNEFLAEQKR